ncbi:radial spoke head protein 9 homolog [Melanotaenia boesemani]|uniref:radial spoke head protein 9 homolog n=1 Tax=Melanotaenia boesemani TaxID=1250792 RepID=UPI001C056A6F|nr:radial spoke head protein 9 homolog [Melanotaenia boesemani]
MDSISLSSSIELVAGSGFVLNVEQRAALQTSLAILKKNYKFQRIMFWGKILGIKQDYFIAQGRGEDEVQDKKYLYSFNCMDWFLLSSVTDSMIDEVSKAEQSRFIGDPSFMYKHKMSSQRKMSGAEDEAVSKVNEEMRLAVTIHHIEEDVSIAPRGAYIKSPFGLVQINRSFGGLNDMEARKLENFMHFRKPKNVKKSIQEMGQWSPDIDFLDVLSDDIPKGSWSLQFESAGKVCVLRSLLWMGLTFYHVPMTQQHGYVYIGDGMKNLNLVFMV